MAVIFANADLVSLGGLLKNNHVANVVFEDFLGLVIQNY